MKKFNYLGEDITERRIEFVSPQYGYVDDNNRRFINWGEPNDIRDSDGFDKRYRPYDNSDEYVINDFIIPKGTKLCRYGAPSGVFTAYEGTTYESLGLPYVKETIEYHEYIVSKDIGVRCIVVKGLVAPMFNSKGGAIQFKHKQSIEDECADGFLEEDFSWMKKKL